MIYSIFKGDTALGTLEELRVESAVVTVDKPGSGDVMELSVARDLSAGMPFTPWAAHRLVDEDGAQRFVGWLLAPPRTARGDRQRHVYRFSGPWQTFLDRTIFRQDSQFPVRPAGASVPQDEWPTVKLTNVLLNYRVGTGAVSIKDQVEEALAYAKAQAGGAFDYDTTNLPTTTKPPASEQSDRTCGEIVRGQLRWCPGIGAYWDYSGDVPKLLFVDEPDTKTVDLRDDDDRPVDEKGTGTGTNFSGTARYDLLVPKVRIDYITELATLPTPTEENPDLQTKSWSLIATDESTADNGSYGAVEHTVVLLKYDETFGGHTVQVRQPTPVGLAALLHAPYKTLSTEMSWDRTEEDVDWDDHPAKEKWNVLGAGPQFEGAEGICQSIVRDLMAGTISYKCGPASALGLSDLLAQIRANRSRSVPSHATQSSDPRGATAGAGSDGGTDDGGGAEGDGDDPPTFDVVTGAVNGVAATRRVAVDPDEDGWQPV